MNAKDKDDKGEWITVKGNHILVKEGQTKEEAVQSFIEKQQGKVEPTQPSEPVKNPPQRKEQNPEPGKKKQDPDEFERIYRKKIEKQDSGEENSNIIKFKKEYATIEGMIKRRNLEPRKEEALLEQLEVYKREFDKNLEPHQEDALLEELNDFKMDIYKNVSARNSKGDLMMSVLNELESFVKGVIRNANDEDEKEIKNEKVDKRELIEEVGGMLKGKVDDEIIKTIIKKMEEASYDESEAGSADNKKVKNESEEEKEDKKAENKKVKNEESEDDKEKVEELKKEEKEDVDNKCNNSKTDFFDKMNKIYNSTLTPDKSETEYTSRADRLKAGEEYFKV